MAIGIGTDFKIYNDQINGAFVETVMQFIDAFGAASRNAILMTTEAHRGDYDNESFFLQAVNALRRDPNDVTALTDVPLLQEEQIRVKLHRGSSLALTRNQWLRIGQAPEMMSRVYGKQLAVTMMQEQLDVGLLACSAALSGVTALNYDASGGSPGTMSHTILNTGISKMGDRASSIVAIVMHSKPWFDLVGSAITSSLLEVGGIAVNEGITGTMGRPAIVTDSASLVVSGTPTKYISLALTQAGIQLLDSESPYTADQEVTGLKNIVRRLQSEWAYNLGIKGFKYNTAGGVNPTNAVVGTSTNWTKVATDNKSLAGVRILTQ